MKLWQRKAKVSKTSVDTQRKSSSPYFSMACSFSSSSLCRTITDMMTFLSSSVRWLKSGISGMGASTVGGRGPLWGPTEADIFCPAPRRIYWQYPERWSHTSRHGPRIEQRSLRIVQISHGFRHPQLCFCFSSCFSSLPTPPLFSLPPPPASPLHLQLREAHHLYARRRRKQRDSGIS